MSDTEPHKTERDVARELPTSRENAKPMVEYEASLAQDFAAIVGNMFDEKLRPVLLNQDLTLTEVRELSLRVGTIEKRMHIGEGRFERIEQDIQHLRGEVKDLSGELDELRKKFHALRRNVEPLLTDGK